jgi:hypothetical protein
MQDIRVYIDKLHSDAEALRDSLRNGIQPREAKGFSLPWPKPTANWRAIWSGSQPQISSWTKSAKSISLGLLGGATSSAESLVQIAKVAEQ